MDYSDHIKGASCQWTTAFKSLVYRVCLLELNRRFPRYVPSDWKRLSLQRETSKSTNDREAIYLSKDVYRLPMFLLGDGPIEVITINRILRRNRNSIRVCSALIGVFVLLLSSSQFCSLLDSSFILRFLSPFKSMKK